MPRIDPMKLLVCLSVLLAPNGGIRTAAEVKRLANLMAKFSKKLVSKCIYIQILKCTETELLGQFMQSGGWALVHMWLVDGIGSKNWPLIQELLELLLCCPVDVERLKINSTPRLVKSLSTDSAHESVRLLATKLVEQWLYIVKAPKQLSSTLTSQAPSEIMGNPLSLGTVRDGKTSMADPQTTLGGRSQDGISNGAESHLYSNGHMEGMKKDAENCHDLKGHGQNYIDRVDEVDVAKRTFRAVVEHQDQPSQKKTSLVLKITTKNGKQVVAKVVSPSNKKNKLNPLPLTVKYVDDEEDDEDEEEVLVNIESDKQCDDPLTDPTEKQQEMRESRKMEFNHHGTKEGNKERSSSSSKDKDRHHNHHRDHRDKDRKSSSSSGGRSSSSKSSSGGGGSSTSGSSSNKHKSSSGSKNSSSSGSSSRHGSNSSSTSNSSSKHKSLSSSSSSKSNSSSSKSGSGSSSHDKHREKSSHPTGSSSSNNKDSKDSKGQSSVSSKLAKLSRKSSKDEVNDSGSESSSTTGGGMKSASTANGSSTSIPSKKASISIEVRNPENRPKTVKTYNSQFRSHGLIEEAPPPPSRKGLKKPSSATSATSATSSSPATSASVGSIVSAATKRSSSPPSSSGKDGGSPSEKKPKEDLPERPGSIKLIPPKRQHALVESDMFMDALSATLRKDVKKRKRRTSGSENPAPTGKPGEVGKPDGAVSTATTQAGTPESPTRTSTVSAAAGEATTATSDSATPTTPTSPKAIVNAIAPMSFYRDTLAEEDEAKDGECGDTETGKLTDGQKDKLKDGDEAKDRDTTSLTDEKVSDEDETIGKKPKRVRCELNDEDDDGGDDGESEKKRKKSENVDTAEDTDKTELMDVVMHDVEKKMAEEAEGADGSAQKENSGEQDEEEPTGKKPPGPGCGPDGPPGVLVIHRRKGPKKQLRWRVADELEEIRYFELDVTERCNVTKSFTDMKQMERVDERQKFLLARKVGSEDVMVERTTWRALLLVDNVPTSPDGSQSVERNVQQQRERGCLQALYFNKHMIPDSAVEPDPADTYQTADPVHIPLEDVTGNPDSVNDFTSMPWPDPKSTPPHESAAFNSPFFPADMPPGGGFGPGGFPPPFPPGAAGAITGPAPWNMHPRPGVLQPGLFPLNQPPPGMGGPLSGAAPGGGGGGSPNILTIPPNIPPPGLFPGATNFNAPPPDLALMGDVTGRRPPGAVGDRGMDFRSGPPPQQQWVTNNRSYGTGNSQRGVGPGFGNRGGGPGGNWNRSAGSTGDRGRNGEESRGNYRGHWMQNNTNRGHNNSRGAGGGRKW